MDATQSTEEKSLSQRLASDLRKTADWIESHQDAACQLMTVHIGPSGKPRVALFSLEPLRNAFPGQPAIKTRSNSHDVYRLTHDGIEFEAWAKSEIPEPTQVEVAL